MIVRALRMAGCNKSKAAEILAIQRRLVHEKMREYEINENSEESYMMTGMAANAKLSLRIGRAGAVRPEVFFNLSSSARYLNLVFNNLRATDLSVPKARPFKV